MLLQNTGKHRNEVEHLWKMVNSLNVKIAIIEKPVN